MKRSQKNTKKVKKAVSRKWVLSNVSKSILLLPTSPNTITPCFFSDKLVAKVPLNATFGASFEGLNLSSVIKHFALVLMKYCIGNVFICM